MAPGRSTAGSQTSISVPAVQYASGYHAAVTSGTVVSKGGVLQVASSPGATSMTVTVSPGLWYQQGTVRQAPPSTQRACAEKNRQMTSCVTSRAVDGGSVCSSRCASQFGAAPGHWWPTPGIVMSSTARPAGQLAMDVLTVPAVVMAGPAQLCSAASWR